MPRKTTKPKTTGKPAPVDPGPKEPKTITLGQVGAETVTALDVSPQTNEARKAIEFYSGFKITCEDEKVFLGNELLKIKQKQKAAKEELDKILNPLKRIRGDALSAMRAAENLLAPLFNVLSIGETAFKNEIMRYEGEVERKRLQAENEARRRAEEEQRRIEQEARAEQEEAARQHLEAQRKAEELAKAGKEEEAQTLLAEADSDLEAAAETAELRQQEAEDVFNQAIVPSNSVKVAGIASTGTWQAHFENIAELLKGIVEGSTPLKKAVRARVAGRLVPLTEDMDVSQIQGLEIGLTWFHEEARQHEKNFSYRGVKAEFKKGLRVSA